MCGIVAVLSRPPGRGVPDRDDVLSRLDAAVSCASDLDTAAGLLEEVDALLRGDAGIVAMVRDALLRDGIVSRLDEVDALADEAARSFETEVSGSIDRDATWARISRVRDAAWALRRDRLRAAESVVSFAGPDAGDGALHCWLAVHQALSAIDRMEVRGRDSAGIVVIVRLADPGVLGVDVATALDARAADPLLGNGSVRRGTAAVAFVYKQAAEIGELGDNTRALREALVADAELAAVVALPGARATVVGHTRWASVGIISEPNAHPVAGESDGPVAFGVLNGDIDNHVEIRERHGLVFPDPITTDATVVPALVERSRASGGEAAFLGAVSQFEGSFAIAHVALDDPGTVRLALHGSGQGLHVGLAEDRFVVASETYGTVEEARVAVRMDGETPRDPSAPASAGQVIVLSADGAGTVGGMRRWHWDGHESPVTGNDPAPAGVTTRDIDRGDHPHFLLKEITESPASFRKTIRGRVTERDGMLVPHLDESVFPAAIAARLADGSIRRVRVIGQGTAAVAGTSVVPVLGALAGAALHVQAMPATELSGFAMEQDMSDMLVIAVSQSGTTTDTNRTVDLVAARGAAVIAIVNRRGSELAMKAHGVYHTSDGRDIEMSVASTKAFYAQVAAGAVLSCAVALAAGAGRGESVHRILSSLVGMPEAMETVLSRRAVIAAVAGSLAPSRRYWAVVGNGPNVVAAQEVRIKLSELCYKSISCDVTEDKKHIDLSCEPLVLVCAAGLAEGTAADVSKEVGIFRAHKAAPIVIATEGTTGWEAAAAVIEVPAVDSTVAFVLSAMAGHLFGYEAALAIDALARPLRRLREDVEKVVARGGEDESALARISRDTSPHADDFLGALAEGAYDGTLEASTAVAIVSLLRTVGAPDPLTVHRRVTGRSAAPGTIIDELVSALTRGIDELTRPVDAIKHQAKTVTVGISRNEEGLLDRPLVRAVLDAGAQREHLSYAALRVLAALDPAVSAVVGHVRYLVEGDGSRRGDVSIASRGGVGLEVPSRVEADPRLFGTKRRVAVDQEVLVARGRKDGRTVVIVPEVEGDRTAGITLLHVDVHDRLPAPVLRQVLQGYDRRYDRLVDWVSETEGTFDEELLAGVSVADLLVEPVSESADLWRKR